MPGKPATGGDRRSAGAADGAADGRGDLGGQVEQLQLFDVGPQLAGDTLVADDERCEVCRLRPAQFYCDFILPNGDPPIARKDWPKLQTCDRRLCGECRVNDGTLIMCGHHGRGKERCGCRADSVDYCPQHAAEMNVRRIRRTTRRR